ncbi:MAG: glucose-6-phosphate dehydrogenase assembly protein OpcA [Acidobacteriia bacterium]|nr:glucose-6-phosphate dehydrogenase assembly protein OpcA [Terriglobia bacterium]
MAASTIRPDKILRELDQLWVSLAKQEEGESSNNVLRACSMTLIVATEGNEDEAAVGETLAALMRDHPSRAIVLRLMPGDVPALQSRVLAQCWMPFGSRQQICCEQIEIIMSQSSLADVPPVLTSLTAPDLPVVLWCRSRRLLALEPFEPVIRLAQKVIIDSAGVAGLSGQVRMIRNAGGSQRVGDLAWTRLTRWRESIAQIFDNPAHLARLADIDKVTISYEGEHIPMSALYLTAWLRNCLGRPVASEFHRCGDAPRARVQSVALTGNNLDLSITVSQDRAVELHAGFRDSHTVFPSLTDYDLLREELTLPGRDAAYDAVLQQLPELTGG